MRPAEIGSLISGLLVLIGLAYSVGQYSRVEEFARRQAVHALHGWGPHPFFVTPHPKHKPMIRHKGDHS